ncbi:MAG: helix-turn-helix domain-containing protein [Bacteroidetes bacterium]|nr:helix-turn-helix domain-containing protein [Bacteroidota bacterium]
METNMIITQLGRDEMKQLFREVVNELLATQIQASGQSVEFVTSKRACEILGITSRTLQNYRDQNKIGYSQTGSKIYYKVKDLHSFLDRHYIKAKA